MVKARLVPLAHFFWYMKVSMESSRAYMKLVWWMGDWVPGDMGALVTDQTTSLTYNGLAL